MFIKGEMERGGSKRKNYVCAFTFYTLLLIPSCISLSISNPLNEESKQNKALWEGQCCSALGHAAQCSGQGNFGAQFADQSSRGCFPLRCCWLRWPLLGSGDAQEVLRVWSWEKPQEKPGDFKVFTLLLSNETSELSLGESLSERLWASFSVTVKVWSGSSSTKISEACRGLA